MEYEEVKPTYEEVNVTKKEIRTDSYFDGKIMEYIGYKLLAFLNNYSNFKIFNGFISFIGSIIAFKFSADTTNTKFGYFVKFLILYTIVYGVCFMVTTFISSLF